MFKPGVTTKNPEDLDIHNFTPEPCRGTMKMLVNFPRITCEAKMDGIRYALMIRGDEITLTGRRSSVKGGKINRIANVPMLETALRECKIEPTWVLDCEMTHPDGLQILLGIMNSLPEESERKILEHGHPVLNVFDCLYYGSSSQQSDMREHPLSMRRELLQSFMHYIYSRSITMGAFVRHVQVMDGAIDPGERIERNTRIDRCYDVAVRLGYEGIVVKNLDGSYNKNNMVKIKPKQSYDMIILAYDISTAISFAEGNAVAALVLGLYDGDKLIAVTKCAGITDKWRYEFARNGQDYIGKVCEVEAQEMFPGGALRHPRFTRLRDDLLATDQTFEKYHIKPT